MPRKNNAKEFFKLIAEKTGLSVERSEILWEQIMDVIVNEGITYGEVNLPYFGTLKSHWKGGKMMKVPINPRLEVRGYKEVYVEPYERWQFNISDACRDMLKGKKATNGQIRRQREAYRQMKREEKIREQQFAYMEKAQLAAAEMQKKNAERTQKKKELNKLSKKKREQLLKEQASYWDELVEAEETTEEMEQKENNQDGKDEGKV